MSEHIAKIRDLNDMYRTKGIGFGKTMMTANLAALGVEFQLAARLTVRTFNEFSKDNDPHAEHDFGAFELHGQKCFWKIDYYNHDLSAGSDNPADPFQTCRVLTIMRAEDY